MNFNNIIGNEDLKQLFNNSINSNNMVHSYMFVGPEGIGKSLFAKDFAEKLLCLSNNKACGTCSSCVKFESDNHPDFVILDSEDGKNIKIGQVRQMQEQIAEKPIVSDSKIFIINNSDLMTVEAQNCLLKTLEEPPEFVNIILLGSNESNFLSTIKSRCTIIKFEDIPNQEIKNYLKEKYNLPDVPESILEASSGSIGKAEILKDKQELYLAIAQVINQMEKMDLIDTIKNANIIYQSQEDKQDILDYMNIILFKKAKENTKYLNCINFVEEAKKRLKANSNYNMTIDNMIMTIWEEIH